MLTHSSLRESEFAVGSAKVRLEGSADHVSITSPWFWRSHGKFMKLVGGGKEAGSEY